MYIMLQVFGRVCKNSNFNRIFKKWFDLHLLLKVRNDGAIFKIRKIYLHKLWLVFRNMFL